MVKWILQEYKPAFCFINDELAAVADREFQLSACTKTSSAPILLLPRLKKKPPCLILISLVIRPMPVMVIPTSWAMFSTHAAAEYGRIS